jgi:hypothetical protein
LNAALGLISGLRSERTAVGYRREEHSEIERVGKIPRHRVLLQILFQHQPCV